MLLGFKVVEKEYNWGGELQEAASCLIKTLTWEDQRLEEAFFGTGNISRYTARMRETGVILDFIVP